MKIMKKDFVGRTFNISNTTAFNLPSAVAGGETTLAIRIGRRKATKIPSGWEVEYSVFAKDGGAFCGYYSFDYICNQIEQTGRDWLNRRAAPVVSETVVAPSSTANTELAELIAAAVAPHVKAGIDRDAVVAIVDERVAASSLPRAITVTVNDRMAVNVGIQHSHFEAVLRLASARLNVWLVGPAGSGKTSVASAVAHALGLPDYSASVCALTSKADLVGYRNVLNGEYVRTDLREAFEHGGVFLLDEVDAGNANVMVILNALLANGSYAFPDGKVAKHPDFVLLAGANTIGMGADRQYVGRNQLDKATVDRFAMVPFPYDPSIEAAMCGVSANALKDAPAVQKFEFLDTADQGEVQQRCEEYCSRVQKIRRAVDSLAVRHIVSPRASLIGCTMIRLGFSPAQVMEFAVWKGLDAETVKKVNQSI
jgi:MoxR-like ATPase